MITFREHQHAWQVSHNGQPLVVRRPVHILCRLKDGRYRVRPHSQQETLVVHLTDLREIQPGDEPMQAPWRKGARGGGRKANGWQDGRQT